MGLIDGAMNLVFGGGRNIVRETAGVFMENAEQRAVREATLQSSALEQFSSEFALPKKGFFDRFIDGINRVPRPALALGTIGLFVSAMVDPIWFAARMNGLALVPEPLWWLMGAIVSFYFGARHQVKSQEFQRDLAATMARAPQVIDRIAALGALRADNPGTADTGPEAALALAATAPGRNPALDHWRSLRPGSVAVRSRSRVARAPGTRMSIPMPPATTQGGSLALNTRAMNR